MRVSFRSERGFTYPELLIAVTLIALTYYFFAPLYKQYNSYLELNSTAQFVRNELRASLSKAQQGVLPSSGERSYWVIHFHADSNDYEIETAACRSFTFLTCTDQSDYRTKTLPERFHIIHQYSGYDEVSVYYAPITGEITVYDASGNILGNSIDLRIQSDDYPNMYVIFRVNDKGNIIEEKST